MFRRVSICWAIKTACNAIIERRCEICQTRHTLANSKIWFFESGPSRCVRIAQSFICLTVQTTEKRETRRNFSPTP